MESTEYEQRHKRITKRLKTTLGIAGDLQGVFVNLDPRGYALKIDYEYMRAHNLKLTTDWGGYGILAPEIGKDGE